MIASIDGMSGHFFWRMLFGQHCLTSLKFSLPLPASLCFCFLFVLHVCVRSYKWKRTCVHLHVEARAQPPVSGTVYHLSLGPAAHQLSYTGWLASNRDAELGLEGTCHHTWLFLFLTRRLNSGSCVCKASSRQALYPLCYLLGPSLKCIILPQTMCYFLYLNHEYILKFKGTRIPRCSLNTTKAKEKKKKESDA